MPIEIKDHQFTLQSYLPPKTLMMSPDWVKMGVEQYYNNPSIKKFLSYIQDELIPTDEESSQTTKKKSKGGLTSTLASIRHASATAVMPTPEALARSLGFANFNSMRRAMEDQSYPEPSRYYLFTACSILADMLTRAGLTSKLDQRFTKFIMSAYMNISEKTEQYTQTDNHVHITWGSDPTRKLVEERQPILDISPDGPHDQFAIDLDKLERALPATMQLPVYRDPAVQQAQQEHHQHEQEMDDQLRQLLYGAQACQ